MKKKKKIVAISSTILVLVLSFVFCIPVHASTTTDEQYWSSAYITCTRNSTVGNAALINSPSTNSNNTYIIQQRYDYSVSISPWGNDYYYNGYLKLNIPLRIDFTNCNIRNIQFDSITTNIGVVPEIVKVYSNRSYDSNSWSGFATFETVIIIPIQGILAKNNFDFTLCINWRCNYDINSGHSPSWSYSWPVNDYTYSLNKTENDIVSNLDIKKRLSTLSNNIANDSSGKSDVLESRVASYDTAESQASSAMAGALPSADTELGAVTSYDYGSIYTDNVSAFSFWKSLGDFILSNSNLVGIGALLILCMFLGLVVYLLRL